MAVEEQAGGQAIRGPVTLPEPHAQELVDAGESDASDSRIPWVFTVVFVFLFLLTGTIQSVWPAYPPSYISMLGVVCLVIRRVRVDRVWVGFGVLALAAVVSGIYNHSSTAQYVFYFKAVLIRLFLLYVIVATSITQGNARTIFRACIAVAMIQLPVVAIQIAFRSHLMPLVRYPGLVSPIDFDYGTFQVCGDPSMTFFLVGIVALVLFDRRVAALVKFPGFVLGWLTATVVVANSAMSVFSLGLVWAVHFALGSRFFQRLRGAILLLLVVLVMVFSEFGSKTERNMLYALSAVRKVDVMEVDRYLRGQYARAGAIYYYLYMRDPLWVGDGPARYTNIQSGDTRHQLGNHGLIFEVYSELGIGGLLALFFFLFLVAMRRPARSWRDRLPDFCVLLAVSMLAFTTSVMRNSQLFFAFAMFTMAYKLPPVPEDPGTDGNASPPVPETGAPAEGAA